MILRVRLHRGWDQRRPDRARAHRVAADTFGHQLVRKAASQCDNGAFGGRVVEQIGSANVGVDGGAVDDGVTGVEVRSDVFGEVEVRVDVGVEGT